MIVNDDFFEVGGTISSDAKWYVERSADEELVKALDKNELCLIMAPRQTGKSSLMVHTMGKIRPLNISSALVDLQALGSINEPEKWFADVVYQIEDTLGLKTDTLAWWEKHTSLGATQRFTRFLKDVVLEEIKDRVVIFFDEIDSIFKLPFSDDFFTCLRAIFNAKASNHTLRRVNFVLLGVATPSEFVKDKSRTPFNIGKMIRLKDFSEEDVLPFKKVLGDDSSHLIKRIFYWCSGQPLIVHILTKEIYELEIQARSEEKIDAIVKEKYFERKIEDDIHLMSIRNSLLSEEGKRSKALDTYQEILSGTDILYDERSLAQAILILSGVAYEKNKKLIPRNEIYKKVFNIDWVMLENNMIFQCGGTLGLNTKFYVKRPADEELVKALDKNELCLVVAPRLTGKSSLMIHTVDEIKQLNISSAIVDFQSVGDINEPEKWFGAVVHKIERSLSLETDSAEWWETNNHIGVPQRFMLFLQDIVLKEKKDRVAIFFDEIDSILNLPFSDDFFKCIIEIYNAKATGQTLKRVNFVLLGVATPSEFVKDNNRTPFNIGKMIRLDDFEKDSVTPFKKVLGENSSHLIDRIFYWCSGQPLMVHKLTAQLYELKEGERTEKKIDTLVKEEYFDKKIEKDFHLLFTKDFLLSDKKKGRKALNVYEDVLLDKEVAYDESSSAQTKLILAGVVREENQKLVSRNRIYKNVFNREWIKRNKPANIPLITSSLSMATMVIVVIFVLIFRAVYEFEKFQMIRGSNVDIYYIEGEEINIGIPDTVIKKITLNEKELVYNIKDVINVSDNPRYANTNFRKVLPITIRGLPLGESEHAILYQGRKWKVIYQSRIIVIYCPKDKWQPITDIEMVGIKGGYFKMGSDSGEVDEKPVRIVCLDSFAISKYEVTQSQWVKLMGYNPSEFKEEKNPVENVSWYDVMEFLRRLNTLTGEEYRLPTEAEWEYACRAGTETAYYWGDTIDTTYLWSSENSEDKTHPVGKKKPNGFGLYDMSGNVWEWCSDWYGSDYYKESLEQNPKGAEDGKDRVLRGGCFWGDGRYYRSADRNRMTPGTRHNIIGFRLARGQKNK